MEVIVSYIKVKYMQEQIQKRQHMIVFQKLNHFIVIFLGINQKTLHYMEKVNIIINY
jgi:hypothetical protein